MYRSVVLAASAITYLVDSKLARKYVRGQHPSKHSKGDRLPHAVPGPASEPPGEQGTPVHKRDRQPNEGNEENEIGLVGPYDVHDERPAKKRLTRRSWLQSPAIPHAAESSSSM